MPLFQLTSDLVFPDPMLAEESGLLAVGGDLDPSRILLGYEHGIFPWFNPEDPILWWSPDPRYVIFPDRVHISKSMRRSLRQGEFHLTMDTVFSEIIKNCALIKRTGEKGSWITPGMQQAFTSLHDIGVAHSIEAWQGDELVGGLYGVGLGGIFYGESMFHRVTNASKACLIRLMQYLGHKGYELMDCQLHTDHLESLGGEHIDRETFLRHIDHNLLKDSRVGRWTDDFDDFMKKVYEGSI